MDILQSILVFLTPLLYSWSFWIGVVLFGTLSNGRLIPTLVGGVAAFGAVLLVSSTWPVVSLPDISFLSTTLQSGTQYMETFLGFIMGAFVFWPLVFVIICIEIATDSEWWAAGTLVGASALYIFLNKVPLTWETAMGAVNYVAVYVVIGLLFTFVKWWVYVRKAGRRFQEFAARKFAWTNKTYWEANYGGNRKYEGEDGDKPYFDRSDVASQFSDPILTVKDKDGVWETSYNKLDFSGYLTSWTVFWPVYAFLIVCEDMIKEFMNWFVETFGKLYKRMADAAFNVSLDPT